MKYTMDRFKSFLQKWMKYIVTGFIFLILITFFGDMSLINRAKNAIKIRELEQEKESYLEQARQYQHDIQILNSSTDSLERFAREHYYMHTADEKVYLIGND